MLIRHLDAISLAGVLAGAVALWCARAISHRLLSRRGSRQTVQSGGVRPQQLSGLGYATLCIVVAALIAVAQIGRVHDLFGAVATGVLVSLVPTAYFIGRDASNPRPHTSIRALSAFIGIVVCAVLVRVVRL